MMNLKTESRISIRFASYSASKIRPPNLKSGPRIEMEKTNLTILNLLRLLRYIHQTNRIRLAHPTILFKFEFEIKPAARGRTKPKNVTYSEFSAARGRNSSCVKNFIFSIERGHPGAHVEKISKKSID